MRERDGEQAGSRASWTRRATVRALAAAGATGAVQGRVGGRRESGEQGHHPALGTRGRGPARPNVPSNPIIVIDGTDVRALALRALDAATAAGAAYADVRFTRQLRQALTQDYARQPGGLQASGPYLRLAGAYERLGVGVRVRVGAGWGFAASPYWEPEDLVRLAREAAVQAKTNARGSGVGHEWAPIPVATGHWATPIQVDPFVISLEEKADVFGAWLDTAFRLPRGMIGANAGADFTREERALATSEGTYVTQTLYSSEGEYYITRTNLHGRQVLGRASAQGLDRTAAGWELFTDADLVGQLPRLWEEADALRPRGPAIERKAGEIGRYEVVFDAPSMGVLLEQTLGVATQLDRALGYEANAGGTSYLGPDPLALLGRYQAASPVVTVLADRTMPRGLATVRWDEEGVVPAPFPLVQDGVLVDYQTTRGLAPLLAPYYQQVGRPGGSHGCAGADSALRVTMAHMPNLVLAPGKEALGFDELVASVKKGFAVTGAGMRTDFQARTGAGAGQLREIVNGKLGAIVEGLIFSFSTPNLWKSVEAVGGPGSVVQYTSRARKGQPAQQTAYSVRAVPAKIKDVDFILPRRR